MRGPVGVVVVVAVAAQLVAASPSGHTGDCNRHGATIPPLWSRTLNAAAAYEIRCTGLECELTGAPAPRGFLISSRDATLEPVDATAKQTHGGACLTHTSRTQKASLRFRAAAPTVVWATVVTHKAGPHRYALTAPTLVAGGTAGTIWIVGGGPGGLAAARRAAAMNLDARVLEAGPAPAASFYTAPIRTTDFDALLGAGTFPIHEPVPNHRLLQLLGGHQNVNGAVFSPGTAADLAASTGMPVAAAAHAQAEAASYVHHAPAVATRNKSVVALMQACLGPAPCDQQVAATSGVAVARRSIAFNFTGNVTTGANVTSITDDRIRFAPGGPADILLSPNDRVIVAAGALVSPQLLGRSSFSAYNHYYKVEAIGCPGFNLTLCDGRQADWQAWLAGNRTQIFDYAGTFEYNYAMLDVGVPVAVNITIEMKPSAPTTYDATQAIADPNEQLGWTHSWHYMGTVQHTGMRIGGKLYSGDAGALRTPFNCHTSMPAAAAGVLAVEAAVGVTREDTPADNAKALPGDHPRLFVAGIWLAAVGVLAHIAAKPVNKAAARLRQHGLQTRGASPPRSAPASILDLDSQTARDPNVGGNLHYALMPISWLVLVAGVAVAAEHRVARGYPLMVEKLSYHRRLGHGLVVLLSIQVLWGSALCLARVKKKTAARFGRLHTLCKRIDGPWSGKLHRWSGLALLLALAGIAAGIAFKKGTPLDDFGNMDATTAAQAAAIAAAAVAALGIGTNALRVWTTWRGARPDSGPKGGAARMTPLL